MLNRRFLLVMLISFCMSCSFSKAYKPESYVVDKAVVFTNEEENNISNVCAQLEANIGSQIVVYSIQSLHAEPIEQFANKTFNTWGIGRKGYDDGVLIVFSVSDRKVRIEVGYGLENIITDIIAQNIIDEEMIGHFKQKEYYKGVINSVIRIKKLIEENPEKVGQKWPFDNKSR